MFNKNFFILAPSYSGTTLLNKLINSHPELTALGDTYPKQSYDQICGCGQPVSQCTFWQAICSAVKEQHYSERRFMLPQYPGDIGGMAGRLAFSDFTSFWASPTALRHTHGACLKQFRIDYERFLLAVYQHTDSPGHIFVDGLKYCSRISALLADCFPVSGIIHLYRSPVDFVSSSLHRTGQQNWPGLVEHTLRYRLYHTRAKQLEQYVPCINIRYEDLIENTDSQLKRLFEFLGVEPLGVEQLQPYFDRKWHFMGSSSLFHFKGEFRRKNYSITQTKTTAIRLLLGGNIGTLYD